MRTRSENTSRKPIQSTKVHTITHPATMAAPRIRSTSTIRRHHKDQPPGHRPRNHPNPRTKLEIARRHRNQSTPASGHTRPLKLFTPIKSASASAVTSPLLPTLRRPSASVEGYGGYTPRGSRGRTTHDTLPGTRSHDASVGPQLHDMSAEARLRGFPLDNKKPRGLNPRGIADRARFELAVACTTTVFKTVSIDRSDTCPCVCTHKRLCYHKVCIRLRTSENIPARYACKRESKERLRPPTCAVR